MRILITGGAGFIGSHLADSLLARGDEVFVVDDLSAGRLSRLAAEVTVHTVNITDAAGLCEVVAAERPEVIYHLAAKSDMRASASTPAHDADVNVVGTVKVLEAARMVGARVVFASSGGMLYGNNAPIPSSENVLPLPGCSYGIAKHSAEQYVGLYNRLHGTRHAVLRLANVFGPRQDTLGDAGVISVFCSRALASEDLTIYGDGTQTRDFVYVRDVVSAFVAACDSKRPGTWNIGVGQEVSILDLVAIVEKVVGRRMTLSFRSPRVGELERSAVAVGRAAMQLGWRSSTRLESGVESVYRWLEAGGSERAPH